MSDLIWNRRPWGSWAIVRESEDMVVKIIRVNPYSALSLQRHTGRQEHWTLLTDKNYGLHFIIGEEALVPDRYKVYTVDFGVVHRIVNRSIAPVQILEVIQGTYDESDIVRLEDAYGRN
jgi:mannose-6-phosphate isomerase